MNGESGNDLWLAARLVELVDALTTDVDTAEYSNTLSADFAELLSPAEIGLLIADDSGAPEVTGASSERARRLLSYELKHGGPSVACFRTGQPLINQVLAPSDRRWPRFSPAGHAAGIRMVSVLPMRRHREIIGSVSVFDARERRLVEPTLAPARALADAAAVGILQGRALRRSVRTAEQLQVALNRRVLIEQAKGMIAAQIDVTPDTAFELLRAYCRTNRRRVDEVAREIIDRKLPGARLVGRPDTGC
ncbi:MAG TPA: GAF and ANTAR domain-containing protein [Pseudonocardiaceae bacterium]